MSRINVSNTQVVCLLALSALALAVSGCPKPPPPPPAQPQLHGQPYTPSTSIPPAPPVSATPDTPPAPPPPESPAEQLFMQAMAAHHETGMALAKVAVDQAKSGDLKELADNIVEVDTRELAALDALHKKLYNVELHSDASAYAHLGLTRAEAGADLSASGLKRANPFDQSCIDALIHSEQGGVRLSRAVLAKTPLDPGLRKLASEIVTGESEDITKLGALYKKLVGTDSPNGGIPPEGNAAPTPKPTAAAPPAGK